MSNLLIRPATVADAQAIGQVQVACWQQRLNSWAPEWFVQNFKADEQAAKYAGRIADPSYTVLVAEVEGQVVGFASSKRNESEPLTFSHQIGALYVNPAHEGQGLGSTLLQNLLERDVQHEGKSLVVWTFRDNLRARRVYEACGGQLLPHTEAADMDLDIPHVSYGWRKTA